MSEVWSEIWRSLVLILFGMLVLRVSGRKSISQMTVPTTIAMISIGTIIVQPIADENIILTMVAAVVFIIVLILVEFMQVRWNMLEKLIKGPAMIVIENGEYEVQNMKKLRLSNCYPDILMDQESKMKFKNLPRKQIFSMRSKWEKSMFKISICNKIESIKNKLIVTGC